MTRPTIQVITTNDGDVSAIVINETRYSPEAIVMLQTHTINVEDHEAALKVWKETAAFALNGYEEEHRGRIEAETRLERYAQRISEADAAMLPDQARASAAIIRYAREYVLTRTDTAWLGLVRALRVYDALGKAGDGRQAS